MQAKLHPGTFIVAVSGGVDSVVLLHLLASHPDLQLIVAHFDHGIRQDSSKDLRFVATLSQKNNLPFESAKGELGPDASEEQARQARYAFLQQVRRKHNADAIVVAHHQDDALETLAFNVLRGTRRKGVSSLQSTQLIIRPLMPYTKQQLREYAIKNSLEWREDSTNQEEIYTRNWIRQKLLAKLTAKQKKELVRTYNTSKDRNKVLDKAIGSQLGEITTKKHIDRQKFTALPYVVSREVMVAWLRKHKVTNIDRRLVDQLVVGAKTLPPGKKMSVGNKRFVHIEQQKLTID